DRQALVDRHPELREIIEDCLGGIDLAFGMQKTSPHLPGIGTNDPIVSPQPLGDFKILRELGRGGMGIVYEAIQLSLGRHVALKVLPMAASLDDRYLQRFKMEAQAAAQLHHNHIVPVYAVGCERGMHYYAMQLINGAPVSSKSFLGLTQQETDSKSTNRPSTKTTHRDITQEGVANASKPSAHLSKDRFRTIVKLVANVADALEYAHSCGVVHRDIKPGNLMLDARGKIWVTDFGLAMVAANNPLTQTGDFVGTLRYMSPEQASGQKGIVDHRADIYALGATLYELLVDRPMMDAADRPSLLHQILYGDPKPLRQIERSIPVELETIVQKATQHNPSDRYQSAEAFANDLRCFLDERPIQARKPSMVDVARKWARRHPAVIASAMFAMLVSVIAMGITIALVEHQRSLTLASLERETDRSLQAEKRLGLAQQAADEMIRLAEDELSDNPFEEGLRMRLLTSALSYYQSFVDEQRENPEAQSDLRETTERLSKIIADLTLIHADRDAMLLGIVEVRRDLKVFDPQETEVLKFIAEYSERRRSWGPVFRPDDDEILEQAKWSNSKLETILTSEQRTRIKQLSIQFLGHMAFRDLAVTGELNLERSQKQRIQQETDRYFASRGIRMGPPMPGQMPPPFGESVGQGGPGGRKGMDTWRSNGERGRPKGDPGGEPGGPGRDFGGPRSRDGKKGPIRDMALLDSLIEILNDTQKAKWQELTGEPFDFTQFMNTENSPP
ncbi:MAG: serine/threonine protein kinase, partial [Pirellula sp.]|nr:serine/threonine protein kinase [Pirellula sp.]